MQRVRSACYTEIKKVRRWSSLVAACCAALPLVCFGAEPSTGTAARIVAWQPHPPVRDFELGYRRHLDWHRRHNDPWEWHGWSIISGERAGAFVDGTFFRDWSDFDNAVAPADDAADNDVNVRPYAALQSVATYEIVTATRANETSRITAPFLMFVYIESAPGRGAELEAAIRDDWHAKQRTSDFLLLRPVDGTDQHLLLLPAERQAQLPALAEALEQLLARIAERHRNRPLVHSVRRETGRYRPDMSYIPHAHSEAGAELTSTTRDSESPVRLTTF
jgi:hypothetical protein